PRRKSSLMSTDNNNPTAEVQAVEAAAVATATESGQATSTAVAPAPVEASTVEAIAETDPENTNADLNGESDGEDFAAMLAAHEKEHHSEISENEVVKGRVIKITDQAVIIDVGFKSEGIVALAEFKDGDNITVSPGDEVDVFVKQLENSEGYVELSRADAVRMQTWDLIEQAYKTGETVKARVLDRIKGGLRVD